MSFTIAIAGKGGVGKTTIAGLLVNGLISRGRRPVLAVDADPNSCLDGVLGVHCEKSIGTVREEAKQIAAEGMSSGISKHQLLEMKIAESLVEADDFDLISMGRSEGPGCYCYANNVLKQAIAQIAGAYPYVVIDNEAGLENLSRRIVQKVDLLVIVTDASKRGLDTCRRIYDLTGEMEIDFSHLAIVVNRMRRGGLPAGCEMLQAHTSAQYMLPIPEDDELADLAESGTALTELSDGNIAAGLIGELLAMVESQMPNKQKTSQDSQIAK